jgi:hypothetical protein
MRCSAEAWAARRGGVAATLTCAFFIGFDTIHTRHCILVDKPMYLSTILEQTARFRHGGSAQFDVGGFSVPTSVVFPASASVLYILMICCRSGLKMDIPLWFVLFHNAAMIALALLVLVGTLVGAYERSLDAGLGGIAGLFCPPQHLASDQLMTGTLGFFLYIFHLSKYVELVDTFILIAKGKTILFLHCYHHCSMLFVTWSWFAFPWLEGAWWCAVVNSIIHSFMYYYYLRTAIPGTKIWWGKYLTSAQIFQVCFSPLFLCNSVPLAHPSVHLVLHWHGGGRVRFRPGHVLRRQTHGNLLHSRQRFFLWPFSNVFLRKV